MTDKQLGAVVVVGLAAAWWYRRSPATPPPRGVRLPPGAGGPAPVYISPRAEAPAGIPPFLNPGPNVPVAAPGPTTALGFPLAVGCSAFQNTPPGCSLAVGRTGYDAVTNSIVTWNGSNWVHVLAGNAVTNPNNPDATADAFAGKITPFAI